ncbi:hypothetical protein [Bizionia sp.]|uniref:hypothetical protein n=1 Tax=Bizionia sp. TaxID=1954480 RepID=UPI003A8F93CC
MPNRIESNIYLQELAEEYLNLDTLNIELVEENGGDMLLTISKYVDFFINKDKDLRLKFSRLNVAIRDYDPKKKPNLINNCVAVLGLLILFREKLSIKEFKIVYAENSNNEIYKFLNFNLLNKLRQPENSEDDYNFKINNESKQTIFWERALEPILIKGELNNLYCLKKVGSFNNVNIPQSTFIEYKKGWNKAQKSYENQKKFLSEKSDQLNILRLLFASIYNASYFTNYSDIYGNYFPKDSAENIFYNISKHAKKLLKESENWTRLKSYIFFYLFLVRYQKKSSKFSTIIKASEDFRKAIKSVEKVSDSIYEILYESIKNTLQHSEHKQGILLFRLSDNLSSSINGLTKNKTHLQITLLDLGSKGIIETLKGNIISIKDWIKTKIKTEELSDNLKNKLKSIKESLKKDILLFKNPETIPKLEDLLSINKMDSVLLHQMERSLGHYGFQKILNEVSNQSSFLRITTPNYNFSQDSEYKVSIDNNYQINKKKVLNNSKKWYSAGTALEIIIDPENIFIEEDDEKNIEKPLKDKISYIHNNKNFLQVLDNNSEKLHPEKNILVIKNDSDLFENDNGDESDLLRKIYKLKLEYGFKSAILLDFDDDLKYKFLKLKYLIGSNTDKDPDHNIYFDDEDLGAYSLVIKTNTFKENLKSLLEKPIGENGYKLPKSHFKLGSKRHIEDFIYVQRYLQLAEGSDSVAYLMALDINNLIEEGPKNILIAGYGTYSEMIIHQAIRYLNQDFLVDKGFNFRYTIINNIEEKQNVRKSYPSVLLDNGEFSNTLNDVEFWKNYKIIIICPIATTFSTAIKIRNTLLETEINNKKITADKFKEPFLNIFWVNGINVKEDLNHNNKVINKELQKDTGLSKVDFNEKNVEVKLFNKQLNVEQKFHIEIKTKWFNNKNCVYCFPQENRVDERVIFSLDKVSVNPKAYIETLKSFTEPKYAIKQGNVFLPPEAYKKNHFTDTKGRHFIHYFYTEPFVEYHKEKIINWLKEVKIVLNPEPNSFIITPSEESNHDFLRLVMYYVFDNQAQLLKYDTSNTYTLNSVSFFKKKLSNSPSIYFVDDFIQTGRSFLRVQNYIREVLQDIYQNPNTIIMDGIICLVNKASRFELRNITGFLPEIEEKVELIDSGDSSNLNLANHPFFSFFDLSIRRVNKNDCTICNERKFYKEIAEESVLDATKITYLKKARKLRYQEDNANEEIVVNNLLLNLQDYFYLFCQATSNFIDINEGLNFYDDNGILFKIFNNDYLKVLVRHYLNGLVATLKEEEVDFDNINDNIFKNILNDFQKYLVELKLDEGLLNEGSVHYEFLKNQIRELVIKVLIQPEFIDFYDLKMSMGKLVIEELSKTEKSLSEIKSNANGSLSEKIILKGLYWFRYYKFILRRTVLLQMNTIMHQVTLKNLNEFYGKAEKFKAYFDNKQTNNNLEENHRFKNKLFKYLRYNLATFDFYFAGLTKELVHNEPSKAHKLDDVSKTNLINPDLNPSFIGLMLNVYFENMSIYNRGINYLINHHRESFKNILTKTDYPLSEPVKFTKCIGSLIKELYKVYHESDERDIKEFFNYVEMDILFDNKIKIENDKVVKKGTDSIFTSEIINRLRTIYLYLLLESKPSIYPKVIKSLLKNLDFILGDHTENLIDDDVLSLINGNDKNDKGNPITIQDQEIRNNTFLYRKQNHFKYPNNNDYKLGYKSTLGNGRLDPNHLIYSFTKPHTTIQSSVTQTDFVPRETISFFHNRKNDDKVVFDFISNIDLKIKTQTVNPKSLFVINNEDVSNKVINYQLDRILFQKNGNGEIEEMYFLIFSLSNIHLTQNNGNINYNLLANIYQNSFKKFDEKAIKRLLTLKKPLLKYLQEYVDSNAHIEQLNNDNMQDEEDRASHSFGRYRQYLNQKLEKQNLDIPEKNNSKLLLYYLRVRKPEEDLNLKIDSIKNQIIDFCNFFFNNDYTQKINFEPSIEIEIIKYYKVIGRCVFENLINIDKRIQPNHPDIIFNLNNENDKIILEMLNTIYLNDNNTVEDNVNKFNSALTEKTTGNAVLMSQFLKEENTDNTIKAEKEIINAKDYFKLVIKILK